MIVEDLTSDIKEMVHLATKQSGIEDLLRFGLEWVDGLAPYDLSAIFLLDGDTLVVREARGPLADDRVRRHRLSLDDFPSLRTAMETRQARAFTEQDHSHGEGDPFDGVIDFPPGHSCMVVPLAVGERAIGIMTLDKDVCQPYDRQTVNLLEIYGQILAMAIFQAEQNDRLWRLHNMARERERITSARTDETVELCNTANPAMRANVNRAQQVALTDTPVLLRGETGTGKELFAAAIHAWSPRKDGPFVKINCAAIPENLLESELFGHVKGAFTGAVGNRPGRFQVANGGTLLLDEIGELPLPLQAKLLRVLQEGTFEPVGSDRAVKVDVRLLAATHVDLERAIAEKRFREDLYYRLSVFPLMIPPLRARMEDLPRLCVSLLRGLAGRTGRGSATVSPAGLEHLRGYHWPGNVRELANVLERALILSPKPTLEPGVLDLPRKIPGEPRGEVTEPIHAAPRDEPILPLDEVEKRYITRVLRKTNGKIYGKGGAGKLLGLKPSTLQSRMKKLGISRDAILAGL